MVCSITRKSRPHKVNVRRPLISYYLGDPSNTAPKPLNSPQRTQPETDLARETIPENILGMQKPETPRVGKRFCPGSALGMGLYSQVVVKDNQLPMGKPQTQRQVCH